MTRNRSVIRVKAMLIAPSASGSHHLVSHNPPTAENPLGFHRLVGGGVEFGETHRQTVIREIEEELTAAIVDLTFLDFVESFFAMDGEAGHELIALYTGRLTPAPPPDGGILTESDGTTVPVVWRPCDDAGERLPLYPSAAADRIRGLSGTRG